MSGVPSFDWSNERAGRLDTGITSPLHSSEFVPASLPVQNPAPNWRLPARTRRTRTNAHEGEPLCTDDRTRLEVFPPGPSRQIQRFGLRSSMKCGRKRNVAAPYTISNPVAQTGLYLFAVPRLHKYVFAGNTKLNVVAGTPISTVQSFSHTARNLRPLWEGHLPSGPAQGPFTLGH